MSTNNQFRDAKIIYASRGAIVDKPDGPLIGSGVTAYVEMLPAMQVVREAQDEIKLLDRKIKKLKKDCGCEE